MKSVIDRCEAPFSMHSEKSVSVIWVKDSLVRIADEIILASISREPAIGAYRQDTIEGLACLGHPIVKGRVDIDHNPAKAGVAALNNIAEAESGCGLALHEDSFAIAVLSAARPRRSFS